MELPAFISQLIAEKEKTVSIIFQTNDNGDRLMTVHTRLPAENFITNTFMVIGDKFVDLGEITEGCLERARAKLGA